MSRSLPQRLSLWFSWLEEATLTMLVVAMLLLACAQIGLRGLFASGLSWADPLLRHLVMWAGLLGAAVATRTDKHISMDLSSRFLPKTTLAWLTVLMHLFAAVVCTVLSWTASNLVREVASYDTGQTMIGLSPWHLQLIFPVAFGLMVLRFIERALRGLITLLSPPPAS